MDSLFIIYDFLEAQIAFPFLYIEKHPFRQIVFFLLDKPEIKE
jgi:hypothetical protein